MNATGIDGISLDQSRPFTLHVATVRLARGLSGIGHASYYGKAKDPVKYQFSIRADIYVYFKGFM
jgi:hypothetical protein